MKEMYCVRCGSTLDSGANFCKYCGAPGEAKAQTYHTQSVTETPRQNYMSSNQAQTTQPQKKKSSDSKGHSMLYGILILLLGVVLTAISYSTSTSTYTVYYGLMIVGAITFLAGLVEYFKKK